MQTIINRKNIIFFISPTGSGKNLLFQLPALLNYLEITIIILPLLSLFQNQLAETQILYISSIIFNAKNPPKSTQLVFTIPEISLSQSFQNFLIRFRQFGRLDQIVIDKYHIILNRTQIFRKNLHRLCELIEKNTQIVFFTAILLSRYEFDLFITLYLDSQNIIKYRLSSNRSNIRLKILQNISIIEILTIIRIKDIQYSIDRFVVYIKTMELVKQFNENLD